MPFITPRLAFTLLVLATPLAPRAQTPGSANTAEPAVESGIRAQQPNRIINPEGFGADSSGAKNSNASIMAAVAAAFPSNGNKCLKIAFPAGVYAIHELDLSSYGPGLCLVGDAPLYGVKFYYDGAGGSGSYMLKMAGQSYGGLQNLYFFGINRDYGRVGITAMAESGIIISSPMDAGSTMTDLGFSNIYGDAMQLKGGFVNLYMRHFRADSIGGYVLNITEGGRANGAPAHIYDFTVDNNLLKNVKAFELVHGYGDGVHSGKGLIYCAQCNGVDFSIQNVRYEHNMPDIDSGNADEGDFYFPDDSGSSRSYLELMNFVDVGNPSSPHAAVSSQHGDVGITINPPSSFTGFNALIKDRTTQSSSGSPMDANGSFWSFGKNSQQMQGFGIEGQLFDTIPSDSIAANFAPRQFGDWFWRRNDFVPGSNGPFRVVTAPLSGRAMPRSGVVVTTSAAIAANRTAGASVSGFMPSTLHLGDNLILVASNGSGQDMNVKVSCLDTTGSGNACPGLSAQGMVVTPAPGCIARSNCPSPATIKWQSITLSDFGLEATRSTSIPAGPCLKGQFVWNATPASGQPMGWACSASSSWMAMPTYGGRNQSAGFKAPGDPVTLASAEIGNRGGPRAPDSDPDDATASSAPASFQSAHSICAGLAASSATLSFPLLGTSSSAGHCNTAPAPGYGFLMTSSGTLSNLTVRCNSTGVKPSSGVFTISDQPSGRKPAKTPITLTYGQTPAGTVLTDTNHIADYAPGDLITVSFTTQAKETLGTCAVAFNY